MRSRPDRARRSAVGLRHDVRQRSAALTFRPWWGVFDVAFIGSTAYALVTGVGPDLGGTDVVGIYRVDGPNSFTVVADIGAWSILNPPTHEFLIEAPSGGKPRTLSPSAGRSGKSRTSQRSSINN
jgi:hypothetical protein